jgi:hypothetical protein
MHIKKLFVLLTVFALFQITALAQVQFNPQVGFTLQSLSDDAVRPRGTNSTVDADFSADIGWTLGLDARIGSRFYFQPGAFFARNVTVTKLKGDTLFTDADLEDKIVRSSLRLKALAGYNLVHKDGFKLRLNAGPSYDFIMSVDNSDDKIDFEEEDFKGGSFNFDAGLGVDIWFLTAEMGYSYGLTDAFDKDEGFEFDSRYNTFYFTLGVVLGNGMKKN